EDLGEDACRGGLPGAARPREQVGLPLAAPGDGVAQRSYDVVLALELAEPAGSVAAVERLGGHRRRAYSGGARPADGPDDAPECCRAMSIPRALAGLPWTV